MIIPDEHFITIALALQNEIKHCEEHLAYALERLPNNIADWQKHLELARAAKEAFWSEYEKDRVSL